VATATDASVDELLANADAAMYVAKTRGKDHYENFEPGMRTAAVERSGLRTDLAWALERGELELHYQPVVDVTHGGVAGFEALLRWRHPQRDLLAPGEFIGLAEESGLIVPIGAWVLHTACVQARAWQTQNDGVPLTMAVNVSARQLQHPNLVGLVGDALAASGLDPSALVLEITESATVADTEATITRLRDLKDLGVGLAIDDFGTGYSSLSYLRRFPVDLIKIDRSFVAGMVHSREDAAIVSHVIGLAHAFGLKVVAEGVETVHQLEELTRLGCDLAQGYNWRRPEPAAAVESWLAAAFGEGKGPSAPLARPGCARSSSTTEVRCEPPSGWRWTCTAASSSLGRRPTGPRRSSWPAATNPTSWSSTWSCPARAASTPSPPSGPPRRAPPSCCSPLPTRSHLRRWTRPAACSTRPPT
jgi:EAL domain-containing protein (putative c-di-GMP-specific phosphodiesterase class I)